MEARVSVENRCFISSAVESAIQLVRTEFISCPRVAQTFTNCFPYSLDHTVMKFSCEPGNLDTFIVTGDIPAMWLRDSTRQMMPYLDFINDDLRLKCLIKGVIRRQVACVLLDPYANAFCCDRENSGTGEWDNDLTDMKAGLHERKWECDSLCAFLDLSISFAQATGDSELADDPDFQRAVAAVLDVFEQQQRWDNPGPYTFRRTTNWGPDAVMENGYGQIWQPCGAVFSTFRPSDDSTTFGFNTPQNLYAMDVLRRLEILFVNHSSWTNSIARASRIRHQILTAINCNAIAEHKSYGKVFCFEFDGFGNRVGFDNMDSTQKTFQTFCPLVT
jgi:uncharacterized protein